MYVGKQGFLRKCQLSQKLPYHLWHERQSLPRRIAGISVRQGSLRRPWSLTSNADILRKGPP